MKRNAVSLRRELLGWILGGLLLGGIVHLVSVLILPAVAIRDPLATVSGYGPEGRFNLIPEANPDLQPLVLMDPAMRYAECRFSLTEDPTRITVQVPAVYWSLALFTPGGLNFFSVNNRAAEKRMLDLRLMTSFQMLRFREAPVPDMDELVLVESPVEEGFALLRVFIDSPASAEMLTKAMLESGCQEFVLPQRPPPAPKTVEPIPRRKPAPEPAEAAGTANGPDH